ncbi:uncharacterized protein LOC117823525 [Notolabrus celidotus]|uniref:uncharacterized protein LOC117823525 n=1 Tax=Notolabrus celidotus TaxID=1203425 RepID=UPI0014904B3A|nr:uncharacterized protein LOC117823525 [Notolabrus celidotus]
MPRLKNHRASAAAKRRMAKLRAMASEQKLHSIASPAHFGTGHCQRAGKWPMSLLTGKAHKIVIPAESPAKKFVLLIGDSHLRSLADGFVKMPGEMISFGFMSTQGAAAEELRIELMNAAVPRTPEVVCLLAPSNNLTASRTIDEAGAAFANLLSSACSRWSNVVVVDFPPRLSMDETLQESLRQKYQCTAARMGVKYWSNVDRFPLDLPELWARDGICLSDSVGMHILAQLLWTAASKELMRVTQAPKRHTPLHDETILQTPPYSFRRKVVREGRKAFLKECYILLTPLKFSPYLLLDRSHLSKQKEFTDAPKGLEVITDNLGNIYEVEEIKTEPHDEVFQPVEEEVEARRGRGHGLS